MMFTSPTFLLLLLINVSPIFAALKLPLKPTPPARFTPKPRPTPAKKPKTINTDSCPPGAELVLSSCQTITPDSAATTNFLAATPTPSASSGGGSTGCDPSDTNCNYCNLALYELAVCSSIVAPLNAYLPDCLCYEATSDGASALWAPNYFDVAFEGCLPYASTSATDYYYEVSSLQGFCSQLGNYDGVAYMDTSIYTLDLNAVATATSAAGGGGGGSVATSTAVGGGGGGGQSSSGAEKGGVGLMGLLSTFVTALMLVMCW